MYYTRKVLTLLFYWSLFRGTAASDGSPVDSTPTSTVFSSTHQNGYATEGVTTSLAVSKQYSYEENSQSSSTNHRSSTKVLTSWSPTDYRVTYIEDSLQDNLGAYFYDARISNYTHMVFLPMQSTLYAVGNRATILKVDMKSFYLLDNYEIPQTEKTDTMCTEKRSCVESTEISGITLMPNEQMIWYCYVHLYRIENRPVQHTESMCIVPQHGTLEEPLLQWESPHFSSWDPHFPTSILNAADGFTYISAYSLDYPQIFRTHMPDWNGKLNWTGALVTDKSRIYIAEPAEILLTFETENEVYFVLRESPILAFARARPTKQPAAAFPDEQEADNIQSSVARLIRICKGDRGGLPHVNSDSFGTFAKADMRCQSSDSSGQHFTYTRIRAAFWDNATQRLFTVFSTEKWEPTGSALCLYDKRDIEASFNGPLARPSFEKSTKSSGPNKNTFPNICERFHSNNLTAEELTLGRRVSLTFPYRYNPIEPVHKRALLVQSGVEWTRIQAYDLPAMLKHYHFGVPTRASVVWVGTKQVLSRLVIYEPAVLVESEAEQPVVMCKMNELRTGESLNVLAKSVTGDGTSRRPQQFAHQSRTGLRSVDPTGWTDSVEEEEIRDFRIWDSKLYIMTNHQFLWLPLSDCARYVTFNQCIESRDPHCGWSWHEARCVNGYSVTQSLTDNWFNTYSPSIDRRRIENVQCPGEYPQSGMKNSNSWSDWYMCRLVDLNEPQPTAVEIGPIGERKPNQLDGFCRCRVCLSREDCLLGTQEVTNCTHLEGDWLPWSTWSSCDFSRGIQYRERSCLPNRVCVGSNREQRACARRFAGPIHESRFNGDVPQVQIASPAKSKIPPTATWLAGGVNFLLLLIVAVMFFLLGCLLSTIVFCLFPNFCLRLESNARWPHCTDECGSRGCCCCNSGKFAYQTVPPKITPDENWSLPEAIHNNRWIVRPTKLLEPHQRLPVLPPKRTKLGRVKSYARDRSSIASSEQLIPAIYLPSPQSITSGPSTVSTVLKEKFTFETMTDPQYDMHEETGLSFNSKDLTENSVTSSPSYGLSESTTEETTLQSLLSETPRYTLKTCPASPKTSQSK